MTEKAKITKVRCPTCKKEARWEDNPFKPFCSERCRLADLGRWAKEEYRIAGERKEVPDGNGEEKNHGESR